MQYACVYVRPDAESFCISLDILCDLDVKVYIYGGDTFDHCEKQSSYEHVCNSDWLPRYSCVNVQIHRHCEW